jgi:hypothetical protein
MNLNNTPIKYRVIVDGKILNENANKNIIDLFVEGLDEATKSRAVIVPITTDGKQVLMG